MKDIKLSRVIIVLLVITQAISLNHIFNKDDTPKLTNAQKIQFEKASKQIEQLELERKANEGMFIEKNNTLKTHLAFVNLKLSKAKSALSQTQNRVELLLSRMQEKVDTSNFVLVCDTLQNEYSTLKNQLLEEENCYEETIKTFKEQMATKETELLISNQNYDELKQTTIDNLNRERLLTEQLKTALKVQKRKNIQNKILSAGVFILTGIATTFLISNHTI